MGNTIVQERLLKKLSEFGQGISKALNFPFGIFTEKGKIVVATGWKEMFSDFYLKICSGLYDKDYLSDHKIDEDVYIFPTRNKMKELVISISIDGRIASWIVFGPFIFERDKADLSIIAEYAPDFGLKKQYYLSLIHNSPILNDHKIQSAVNLIRSALDFSSFQVVGDELTDYSIIDDKPKESNIRKKFLEGSIDLEVFQIFQDNFSKATHVNSILLDVTGELITKPSFTDDFKGDKPYDSAADCCNELRKNVGKNNLVPGNSEIYQCPECDKYISVAPLIVDDKKVGDWFISTNNTNNCDKSESLQKSGKEFLPVLDLDSSLGGFVEAAKLLSHIALRFSDLTRSNVLLSKETRDRMSAEIKFQDLNSELESRIIQRTHLLEEALEELRFENEERRRTELALYRAQDEIHDALEREKELNMLKSRFVSMVSHEYRSPLTFIMSSTYLVEQYHINGDSDKINTSLEKMRKSVHHLSELLKDVLYIGRLEHGKFSVTPENFEVLEFANEIVEQVKSEGSATHNIKISTTAEDITIISDKNLLRQIVTNLIVNAVKYSPNNSDIIIGIHEYIDKISIAVTDKGIGIDEDDLTGIFEPFQRGTNVGKISGSGLGLAIVKKCADAINGVLSIKSVVNSGSSFTIQLPKILSLD